jgi:hypothetical protein
MIYELAKELYDAGFPQGGKGSWTFPPDKLVTRHADRVYIPTLSELIEASGDAFYSLENHLQKTWIAHFRYRASGMSGSSPEEAVARLWLALSKKV